MPITRGQNESHSEESQATGGENRSKTPMDRVTVVQKQLETSFKVALHLDSQTETILESKNERKLQRHKGNLEEKLNKLHGLVSAMIELTFEQRLDLEAVDEWATEPNKEQQPAVEDQTYAKEELGTKPAETKILGMKWDKAKDTLANDFRGCKQTGEGTKRGMLQSIARVYDPLGVTSPLMLDAKEIYRKTCEEKHSFVSNTTKRGKTKGVLTTNEINHAETFWIKFVQEEATKEENHSAIASKLDLEADEKGVLRCKGRIIGEHLVYLPRIHRFASLVVSDAHERTLHGGYRARPLPTPTQAPLPEFRTTHSRAFETVGLDFAGPISYKIKKGFQGKCNVTLFTCATSRAVHLHLLPDMTAEELKGSLAEIVARRGRPAKIVSDNAKTFVVIAKWLRKLKRSQVVNDYLARREIHWQFNLARSPWWSGFFERMRKILTNKSKSRALRDRHGQLTGKKSEINVGDVMLLQGEEESRGLWKMGVVEKLIAGKDGVVRGAILKTGNGRKERPLQHLYLLELASATTKSQQSKALNPNAKAFEPRKSRAAKTKALQMIGQIISDIADSKDN
ncbi:Pro-Pol poly [Paramuricea clavata]|uniref:Pro-Pol poly n=1 Tax=Paramuricea clavata TaxID=317549 RepID=A0A7D9IAE5_PARCT|nr:Pro-Pol poly [Paramuricea clavata]